MILIEVNAIRRSGHHAFINWLIANLNETKYEENLCKYKANRIDGKYNILWVNEGEQLIRENIDIIDRHRDNSSIDITIISYEVLTNETDMNPNYTILDKTLRKRWDVTEHIHIPFVRDYYNNVASLMKLYPYIEIEGDDAYNVMYHDMYTAQLKHVLDGVRGVVYDKWVSDKEYANLTCIKLLGKPNMFNPLELGGTPSSWNMPAGLSYDKNEELKLDSLLNRYKTATFPKWMMDKVNQDEVLSELIKRAGFDKQDIKVK
jgi:hypothetical protein|tara:strand:- start:64 stop:846 length:783 start_codon:yes stop_codon:yes gene_type:complete